MVKVRRKKKGMKLTGGDLVFHVFNTIFMIVFLIIMVYPLYFTVIASVSNHTALSAGRVFFWPIGFNINAYRNVFYNQEIWIGYRNSMLYVIGFTSYNLAIMFPLAYGLSKRLLPGRSTITWYFLITMFVSGGMIPNYLLRLNMGLLNTPWVLMMGAVPVTSMIITRTFLMASIPEELYESARIDGANEFHCFFKIALPLSTAVIAVMTLTFSVSFWNSFFAALLYITRADLYPLQLILRQILIRNQRMVMDPEVFAMLPVEEQQMALYMVRMAESMRYALVFIASAPLLLLYPFVQKYFVKGIMIGSLKG